MMKGRNIIIIILFGEQLSHIMKIKEGNRTKRYENLLNLFDHNVTDKFESITDKKLKDNKKIMKYLFCSFLNSM